MIRGQCGPGHDFKNLLFCETFKTTIEKYITIPYMAKTTKRSVPTNSLTCQTGISTQNRYDILATTSTEVTSEVFLPPGSSKPLLAPRDSFEHCFNNKTKEKFPAIGYLNFCCSLNITIR